MTHATSFNAATAARIEALYQTPDVVEQRMRVLRRLALSPGEAALDIGAGPGLLLLDMARLVAPLGRAVGIDPSADMVEMARRRLAGLETGEVREGDALALPFPDGHFDAVVATQVLEYVTPIETALQEIFRVLKPGGRVVVLDTDYDSFVLAHDEEPLSRRVLEAWDEHFVHRDLPRRLPGLLRGAGFESVEAEAMVMLATKWQDHTFAAGLLKMMAAFAAGRAGLAKEDGERWREGLLRLDREGRFFFSLNRYLIAARRPARGP